MLAVSPGFGKSIAGPVIRLGLPFAALACALSSAVSGQTAQAPAGDSNTTSVSLTPAQLFSFADAARDAGDFATAEQAYRALGTNPDIELRTEARFRLAMMLADRQRKFADAAVLLRQILDEKPHASRVRVELARMRAMMGDIGAAEREFRAAQADGLPPEVERMVRFYANALNAAKPFGFNLELAMAPDTNINRATRSDTLGTIIGDFTLDQNAKAKSGVGLDIRAQAWARTGIDKRASLLVRASGSGDIYRRSEFNDYVLSLQAGPEYQSGKDRIAFQFGPAWRWYGSKPYTFTVGGNVSWTHPVGKRAQFRVDGGIAHVDNRRNDLQDSDTFSASLSLDRAFTARSGAGLQLSGYRDHARDPGYATASGGANVYAFREFGRTTAVVSLGYNHLEADRRLFLYPKRRVDDRLSATVAGTFRALTIGTFAPFARLKWERNWSTVEIYDYQRKAAEFGVTAAF